MCTLLHDIARQLADYQGLLEVMSTAAPALAVDSALIPAVVGTAASALLTIQDPQLLWA
jgi:hypothetical protein